MSYLTLKSLHDDALFYTGENADKVQAQWLEDAPSMYRFDNYVSSEAMPLRFKVMLNLDTDAVSAVTLNLCVPRGYMSLPDGAMIHLTMRSLIEIFGDQLVGILNFQNQSVTWMDEPAIAHFKSLPVFKKKVNLLTVIAYLRGIDGYSEFESVYALEFKDLRQAETLKSCTEIYSGVRMTSDENEAETLFTTPTIDFFVTRSDDHRASVLKAIEEFKDVLSAQVNECLAGACRTVISIVGEE